MNKTLETLKEMLNCGMIDQEEYKEEKAKYILLLNTVRDFEDRISEQKERLGIIKREKRNKINDRRLERLFDMYIEGRISKHEMFQIVSSYNQTKALVRERME